MKVSISVGGRFHAFHLANQLEGRGFLQRVFTSYPYSRLKDCGVGRDKITSLVLKEVIERGSSRIPLIGNRRLAYYAACVFDRQVSRLVKPCDLFVGWSGFSLFTARCIKKSFPAKIIIERGSFHIKEQRDILKKEADRLGITVSLPDPKIVDKELQEYGIADYISVPSSVARESFIKHGFDAARLIQTALGVDTDLFSPAPKQDSVFRVITVGLDVRKGTHHLLELARHPQAQKIEFWLIGRPSRDLKPLLKTQSSNVKYLGTLPHARLSEYYTQGSVFILPSIEDGFGMAVLEAMACGLPVICSDKAGAKDITRQNTDGFVFNAGDIQALKENLLKLYENPGMAREMGRNARANVENNFTWSHYGKRIVDAYSKILGA